MKGLCTLSIDPVIAGAFKAKYPGKASSVVEQFMRDCLEIYVEEKNIVDFESNIEKVQSEIARKKIELHALQLQKKATDEEQERKSERLRKDAALNQELEYSALKDIKLYGWDIEFALAKSKDNTLTASQFLAKKQEAA